MTTYAVKGWTEKEHLEWLLSFDGETDKCPICEETWCDTSCEETEEEENQ